MMEHESVQEVSLPKKGAGLEKISHYALLVVAFFLPIFFIPGYVFSFQFGKTALVALGTLIAFSFWGYFMPKERGI